MKYFKVPPHMLGNTYITNLIHSSVVFITVQYLADYESSKSTVSAEPALGQGSVQSDLRF